jgi:large subunit ribosomal protein L9
MKVILTEDVPELGTCGQTITVKSGYGRNFLLPRHLAIPATKGNLRAIDNLKEDKGLRDKKRRREAEKVREALEKLTLTTHLVTDEEGKVFGSVTARTIADLVKEAGITLERRAIQLDEPIKSLGMYTVSVKIEKDVMAGIKLFVEKKVS